MNDQPDPPPRGFLPDDYWDNLTAGAFRNLDFERMMTPAIRTLADSLEAIQRQHTNATMRALEPAIAVLDQQTAQVTAAVAQVLSNNADYQKMLQTMVARIALTVPTISSSWTADIQRTAARKDPKPKYTRAQQMGFAASGFGLFLGLYPHLRDLLPDNDQGKLQLHLITLCFIAAVMILAIAFIEGDDND